MLARHHWAKVFYTEVTGQGGGTSRYYRFNDHVLRAKASHTVFVDFGCGQQPGEDWALPGLFFAQDTTHDEAIH